MATPPLIGTEYLVSSFMLDLHFEPDHMLSCSSAAGASWLCCVQEVVKLDQTPQAVLDAALKFVKSVGKTPVVCKDTPGFVVNRLLVPYMAQALKLVEDGVASHKDVDIAMKLGAGHPMVSVALNICSVLCRCRLTVLYAGCLWRCQSPRAHAFVTACGCLFPTAGPLHAG